MLLPNFFQVMFLLREPLVVLEGAALADENTEVHYIVACFVLHTVDAELVELVIDNLSFQIGD